MSETNLPFSIEPYCPTCGAGEPLQMPLSGFPCGGRDSERMCTKCATRWILSKDADILQPMEAIA